jgi:hypothetical protein
MHAMHARARTDSRVCYSGHTLRFPDGPYGYNFLKLAGTLSFYE